MSRVIMLEIGGLGFVRSIRPGSKKLRNDASVVVVDEQNQVLWFWIGSSIQYDKRRTARQKVDKISVEGQRLGDQLLGQGYSVVEIDQDSLDNPATSSNYTNLISLLDSQMEISTIADPKGTLIVGQLQAGAATSIPVTTGAQPTAETIGPTPATAKPTPTPSKKVTRLDLEAALMAIIRVHQQVHIEYKGSLDKEEVIIEAIDGLQHKMKRSKGKLAFNWDPKTPKELKELVARELKGLAG